MFNMFEGLPDILISTIVSLSIILALIIIKKLIVSDFKSKAQKHENKLFHALSEVFKQIKIPLLFVIAIYFGIIPFNLPEHIYKWINTIFIGTLILQIMLLLQAFISIGIDIYTGTINKENKELKYLYRYLANFLVIIVWVVGILLFLSNVGYDVSSLIASLGIGGLAIALAVQNILKDIFSSFMILINKPFQVGDYVKLSATEEGTISKIGIKNTIIKTLEGSELIVTNDDILNSRLYNFRSRKKRRVALSLNIDLDTTKKKIEALKKEVLKIIEAEDLIEKDNVRITLDSFTPQAIVINIVFHLINNSFEDFADTKDRVNLKIKELLEKLDIKLAKSVMTQ